MTLRMKLVVLTLVFFPCAGSVFSQQATGPSALAHQLNDTFADVYEKVAPSVVVITVQQNVSSYVSGLPQGLDLYADGGDSTEPVGGSGVIIRKDGYILTNEHVVDNASAGGISVLLKDGRKFRADIVGVDKETDLAVIKVTGANLQAADLGDSDRVRVGQFAFALGASENLPFTFTAGIVSGKDRSNLDGFGSHANFEDYIQTDAPINPGNSGGPLCDIDGKVVGINTMILGLNRGIGFAIPMNMARDIGNQLIANGHVSRPQLGIRIRGLEGSPSLQQAFPNVQRGVFVADIIKGSTADDSDLRQEDVILKIDDVPVGTASELQRQVLSKKIGQTVKLNVWRDGRELTVSVKTGEAGKYIQAATRLPPDNTAQGSPDDYPGFHVRDLPPASGPNGDAPLGVQVTDVVPESAAAAADIRPSDVIVKAGDSPIRNTKEFDAAMANADPARGILFEIRRGGETHIAILSVAKPQ